MNIQVATLCDAATNHNQRLCVLGAFDTIHVRTLPAVHPYCSFAMRLCFAAGDEGRHRFSVRIVDDDGIDILAEPVSSEINIELPGDAIFMTMSLVMNFLQLRFERAGHYSIDLVVDDQMLTRIPLRVNGAEKVESGRSWGTPAA
jgi:hypothetical protein